MDTNRRFPVSRFLLLAASLTQVFLSCNSPFKWNADIKEFVDDGQSILKLEKFVAESGGMRKTVVPSCTSTVVTMDILNPRSIQVDCTVLCADESLFDSLPVVSVSSRSNATFSFTPALRAERKDLVFTVQLSSPETDHVFPPETVTIHCNTPPTGVAESLDAALDGSGAAFAAFKLPSSPTDDDLAQVKISYASVDGSSSGGTVTYAVDEACLCTQKCKVGGTDLLGAAHPLNRYYQPSGIGTGDNYLFTVALVDTEGMESEVAEISSDATLYSVTYDGNGAGIAPVDTRTYRHTKPVTVLGQGTLMLPGYTFAGWNTASDGSGAAYAPGTVFKMGPGNLKLYAMWVKEEGVTITFEMSPSHTIVFPTSTASESPGKSLELKPSVPITGLEAWHWYINDKVEGGQTTSTFIWNIPIDQPLGQYIINVDAVYVDPVSKKSYPCTGSIRVTVTYETED